MSWLANNVRAARYAHSVSRSSFHHHPGLQRLILAAPLALAALLVPAASAAAQTWTGGGTSWNTATNWSPVGVPNSGAADVNFTGNGIFYAVNILSSVSARSLSFSNSTLSYSLTSSANQTLSGVSAITVAAGVTAPQSNNLANIATGSLRFPSNPNTELASLMIANNSTAAGTTLVIGPNTVITPSNSPGGNLEVTGVGTTEISGSYRSGGVFSSLRKTGAGTLILSNPVNTYSSGTNILGGKLVLGAGTAIPTGGTVDLSGGAEFNIGSLSNTAATSIGRLFLDHGNTLFRVPSGNGDYYIDFISMWGSTIDFTGTTNFWLHLKGHPSDNGVFTNGWNTTANWIGSGTSRIQNELSVPMGIHVQAGQTPSGIDLDAGIILSNGGTNPTFVKNGDGTMRLTNPGNTANINVVEGKLRVDDMANLGSGVITVNGGTLQYGGPSATTTKNLNIEGTAAVQVSSPGTTLNYNGVMSQGSFAHLHVPGPGAGNAPSTLRINNNNFYYGNTAIYDNAILAIPTINNIGDASPIGLNLFSTGIVLGTTDTRGTLLLTGTSSVYSSNRKATLNGLYFLGGGGAFGVENAATSLTLSGPMTGAGSLIKTGAGTILLTNTSNSYSGGTYVEGGRLHVDNDAALGTSEVRIFSTATFRYNASATTGRSIVLEGGVLEAPGGISLATGRIQGQGTVIGNVANSGFMEPESSTGLLTVEGNYTQGSSGRMIIFADLLMPLGVNPRLEVIGDVTLDGTLQINLGSMGQFRGTRSFDVLDWTGSLNGTTFSTLQLPMFGGMFTWDTSQLYSSGVLTLTGPPPEADYNHNGVVDAADYVVWRKTDGNQAGFDLWRQQFGIVAGGGSGSAIGRLSDVPVPEPATAVILLLAAAVWCLWPSRAA